MTKIKRFNADMFYTISEDYREFHIKQYIKDQQEYYNF